MGWGRAWCRHRASGFGVGCLFGVVLGRCLGGLRWALGGVVVEGWLVFCRRFGALRWLLWVGFPGGGGLGVGVCIKSSEVL